MDRNADMNVEDGTERRGCAVCGSEKIQTSMETDKFAYGTGPDAPQLTVQVPVRTCLDCGFQFTDHEAEDARHEAVCRHLGVLTPRQVCELRMRYGFSRAEFARLTRIGEASLARWESGSLIQNGANDQFLRLLFFPENMDRLRHMSQAPRMGQTQAGATIASGSDSVPVLSRFRHLANPELHRRMAGHFVLRSASGCPQRRESCT